MNEKIREMKSGLKKMYIIIVVIVYQWAAQYTVLHAFKASTIFIT